MPVEVCSHLMIFFSPLKELPSGLIMKLLGFNRMLSSPCVWQCQSFAAYYGDYGEGWGRLPFTFQHWFILHWLDLYIYAQVRLYVTLYTRMHKYMHIYLSLYVCMHSCMCHGHVLGGQRIGVVPLFPPCRFQGSNSGCYTWWQVSLPVEASH